MVIWVVSVGDWGRHSRDLYCHLMANEFAPNGDLRLVCGTPGGLAGRHWEVVTPADPVKHCPQCEVRGC